MSKKDLEILLELLDKYKELLQNDIVMASSLRVSAKNMKTYTNAMMKHEYVCKLRTDVKKRLEGK